MKRQDGTASVIGTVIWKLAVGLAIFPFAGGGILALPAGPAGTAWRWEKTEGATVALSGPAGLVWRFQCDPAQDVPYFHPLNTVEGRTLTADKPADHLWHHGLWFSWKYINGVNYWEIDGKTGRPAGRTSWQNVEVSARGDGTASITMDLAYQPAGDGVPVLTEKRMIDLSAPDADGTYAVDWTGRFTAVRDVVLDRTPLPGEPDGRVYGGYAGLSVRLAGNLEGRELMTSDGPVLEMTDDRYRGRHVAAEYSGLIDGRAAGIAVCDSPQNPRNPTPWYMIRSSSMSFFTPALLCYGPLTLRSRETLVLRYRVLVHAGRWDSERLRREADRFSQESLASD